MNSKPIIAMVLATAFWAAPAPAQNVYRCGDSYSQQPCPGGRVVATDDTRSAVQRAQTSEAAQRDAKAADALEKARLKEEAKPVQAYIPPPKTANDAPAGDAKPVLAKPRKPQYFTARAPGKPGKATKKKKSKKPQA